MIIDLSEWNEYVADDVPPGPIPSGVKLDVMQILTSKSYINFSVDGFPEGLRAEADSIKIRLFWRVST